MEKKDESEDETPSLDDDHDENPEEFQKSKFGVRKITKELLLLNHKIMKSEGNDLWNQLPELKYPVTKINQFGKRQPRTLKLSSVGIENIRKNGKVSSVYGYEQVKKVTMKNLKTFIIKYEGAKHDYQYRSPVAMHIVQEITSRISIKRQIQRAPPTLGGDIAQKHQEKLQRFGLLDRMPKKPSMREIPEEERKSYQAKKLQHLLGATEEQRLESAVDSITLDTSTTEGRTLKQFCNNFSVLEQNPATLVMNVRQFIDDLRAYIMEKHYKELSKLFIEASSKSFTPEELSLSSVIERSLEKAIVTRFYRRIINCLKHPSKEEEMTLRRNILKAQEKPQEFFGIKPHFISDTNWADAVYELKIVNELDMPSQQLAAILAAAKAIYGTFNWEKNKGKVKEQRKSYFLTADDFFPIFLYVVVHSNIKQPQVVAEYLWNLCDPEQLNGEGGYYLTVFCSALEYLKHAFDNDITAEENDILLSNPTSTTTTPPTTPTTTTTTTTKDKSPTPSPVKEGGSDIIRTSLNGSKRKTFFGAGKTHSNNTSPSTTPNHPTTNESKDHGGHGSGIMGLRPPPLFSTSLSPLSSPSSSSSSWTPSEGSLTPGSSASSSSFKLTYNVSSDSLCEATPPSSPRRKSTSKQKMLKRTSSLPSCRTSEEFQIDREDFIVVDSRASRKSSRGASQSEGGEEAAGGPSSTSSSMGCYGDIGSGIGARVSLVRTNSVMLLKNVAIGGVERLRRLRSGEVMRAESKSAHMTIEASAKDRSPLPSPTLEIGRREEEEESKGSWRACKPHIREGAAEKETFL